MSEKTLFCGNCGAPLLPNSKFCKKCGAAVPEFAQEMMRSDEDKPEQKISRSFEEEEWFEEDEFEEDEFEKKGMLRQKWKGMRSLIKYLILAVVVAVVAVIVILLLLVPDRVELNRYLEMDIAGLDGYGTVTCAFDTDAFFDDYGDTVHFTGKARRENAAWNRKSDQAAYLLVESCVDWDIVYSATDRSDGTLSNGDQLTVEWNCNDQVARKYFRAKLQYSDLTYIVADLSEPEEMDPFEYISLVYEGMDTMGYAYVELSDEAKQMGISEECVSLSQSGDLSNGDRIVVSLNVDLLGPLMQQNGIVLTNWEQEYVVEGLDAYPAQEDGGEYLCEFSSERLLTEADMLKIEQSNYGELPVDRTLEQMMINEIYARNGYRFETEEIQAYFEAKEWYREIKSYEPDMDVVSERLSQTEKDNIIFLQNR